MTGPAHLLHPDYLELLKTMPRNAGGFVMDLHFVPGPQVEAYEAQWRQWCKDHPDRTKWPPWLHKWIETKKRRSRAE